MFNSLRAWILALLCLANLSQAAFVGYHDGTHAGEKLSLATQAGPELRTDPQDCPCGVLHLTGRDAVARPALVHSQTVVTRAVRFQSQIPATPFRGIAGARAPPSLNC